LWNGHFLPFVCVVMKSKIFVWLVIALTALIAITKGWRSNDGSLRTNLIQGDGVGYYMYLPSMFVFHNLSNQEIDNRFVFDHDGEGVNKYFAGTSYLMSPFFFAAFAFESIRGEQLDPYCKSFQVSIAIAALVYFVIGVFALVMLMREMLFSERSIFISIAAIVFGTNLLVYTVYHPSYSHVYSFACNSLFLLFARRLFKSPSMRNLALTTVVLGLSIAIRPINMMVVMAVPFLSVSNTELQKLMRFVMNYRRILLVSGILFFIWFPQLLIWRIESGSWLLHSYKNEGFYFDKPQIVNFLFSFRKGLFIYSPILLIGIIGGLFFAPSRVQRIFFGLFFLLFVYISSSWWNWYYGPSFGQRVMVDFLGVLSLGFAIIIERVARTRYFAIVAALIVAFVLLNLAQSYQYTQNILCSWNMNYEKYKYAFLSFDKSKQGVFGGQDDIAPYGESRKVVMTRSDDFSVYPTGSYVFSGDEFGPTWEVDVPAEWTPNRTQYAEIEIRVLEEFQNACFDAYAVIELNSVDGERYFYRAMRLLDVPNGLPLRWISKKYSIELDPIRKQGDKVKVYIWNKGLGQLEIDDFRLTLCAIQ
jgi:hypothetical protein